MKPYYQDDRVTLYHGDCREVLAGMADRSVDCVITDPPYDARTHRGALTNKGGANRHKERIYFSPACIDLNVPDLFDFTQEATAS